MKQRLDRGELVLLDGGIGTEVLRRGVYWRCHGIERKPDVVRQIHADYIDAGADVIKTNTFQLNRRAYTSLFHGLEHMRHIGPKDLEHKAGKLVAQAVELAREARRQTGRENDGIAIAGVISPLEHSFRPDLVPPPDQARRDHAEIVGQMKSGGVDIILFESMNSISEARAAVEAARAAAVPVWISFVVREGGQLLSKESIADAVKVVEPLGVDVVAVNCAPIEDITTALAELRKHRKGPVGAFAHIGRYDPPSWKFGFYPRFSGADQITPAKYLEAAREWKRIGAQVIGGCCGTTPAHVRAMREGL